MMILKQQSNGLYHIYDTAINCYGQIHETPHNITLNATWVQNTSWIAPVTLELAKAYCHQVRKGYKIEYYDYLGEEYAVEGAL